MVHETIAVISDCDDTLCPDTTNKLVQDLGIDSSDFWRNQVAPKVDDGWDPPLAYLTKLLEVANALSEQGLTKSFIRASAAGVRFFPGALDFVRRIRELLSENAEYREAGISVEWYIVSSGIEELLRSTPLADEADGIFACTFDYSDDGSAVGIKRVVTFTEKTKFVYAINKGISEEVLRRLPYRVNDAMEYEDRRVPFENMVYLGDGPSDIPCFSMIRHLRGKAIGVIPPDDRELRKPYELAEGDRLTVGPYTADYRDGTDLFKMTARIVTGIADDILERRAQRIRPSPTH
ncbi:MAG: haloacid dehalogenase-like hydrolase [Dehalococcoidia bacterium]|nr:haloacid dehalogenase-like hydrolase [Dehalococcoidia bacterium]